MKKTTREITQKHTPVQRRKKSYSCFLMSIQCPTIWHFGWEPMQSDGEIGQRWWEPSLMWDGRHYMSHTLRCCAHCHRNKHSLSCSNQLVPLELLTRRAEHKGLYCGLMYLLDRSWQAQTRTNITVNWYQREICSVCILGWIHVFVC